MEEDGVIQVLTLENVAKGAVPELFQREVAAVLANIADPNTEKDAMRQITIELSFAPFSDRDGAQVSVKFKTKLAGVKPEQCNVFIERVNGSLCAVPQDIRQQQLFGKKQEPGTNVVPMKGEA